MNYEARHLTPCNGMKKIMCHVRYAIFVLFTGVKHFSVISHSQGGHGFVIFPCIHTEWRT